MQIWSFVLFSSHYEVTMCTVFENEVFIEALRQSVTKSSVHYGTQT
ncbi:hypothetical protein Marme_2895 [Marinomonas mediterranea MMB-1]|uniref:Uncharacterized protein n=1 Tax=Marinomonas mediterranea (strain ATCC 700492 / JCM 21426 / NBRC 103028 / MMB-1) TaxID=717774 RepID=F2K005_MARM1|nr:hypothetical protein Marme_2895 [Marinomonas mediterranea MMB-1]